MDCTQVLPSISSSNTYEKGEKKRVATLTINGITHNIYNCENVIGRAEICNIIIRNEAISSRHAIIEADEFDEHVIYDLGSTNKTKLGKTILKPHVRYFINDDTKLAFAEENALYKYVAECRTPSKQEASNFTIPETPEKSDSSSVRTSESEKENEIIESSDIDMFEEPFEEEMKRRESCNLTDEQDFAINESNKNSLNSSSLNVKSEKLSNNEEDVSKILNNENHMSQTVYSVMKTKENEENSGISIYDIPTQTFKKESDVGETITSIREADTQQLNEELDKETSSTGNNENVRSAEFSDIHDDDTLDPLDFEHDSDCKKDDADQTTLEKHEEITIANRADEDVMEALEADDDAFSIHKGRSVTEIHTQDLLYRSRDSDSGDEMLINTQYISCDDTEEQKLKAKNKIIDVIVQRISSIEENTDTALEKKTKTEFEDICSGESSEYQAKTTKQNQSASNENICLTKAEVTPLDDVKEEEFKLNYKEKRIKLSQMMKPSAEPISSPNANTKGTNLCSGNSEILINEDKTVKRETFTLNELGKSQLTQKDSTVLENLSLCHLKLQEEVQIGTASTEKSKTTKNIKQYKKLDMEEKYAEKGTLEQIVQLQKIPDKRGSTTTETGEERGLTLRELVTQSRLNTVGVDDENSKISKKLDEKNHKMNKCEREAQLVSPEAVEKPPSRSSSNDTIHLIENKNKRDDEIIELKETKHVNEHSLHEMETQPISPINTCKEDDRYEEIIGKELSIYDMPTQPVLSSVENTSSRSHIHLNDSKNCGCQREQQKDKNNKSDLLTQPVLIPIERRPVKEEAIKDLRVADMVTQTLLPVKALKHEVEDMNDLSDHNTVTPSLAKLKHKKEVKRDSNKSDMFTLPVLVPIVCRQVKQEAVNDLSVGNRATPVLPECRSQKEKVMNISVDDMATQLVLPASGHTSEGDVTSISTDDMVTQPLLPGKERRSQKEDVMNISIGDMATQPVLQATEFRSEKDVTNINLSDMATQPVLPVERRSVKEEDVGISIGAKAPTERKSRKEEIMNISISDMATQPVLPPTESRSGKEEVLDISLSDMATQPVLPPTKSRSGKEEVLDISLSDMATQPVLPPTESRSVKEVVVDISIGDMATQPVLQSTERKSRKEEIMNISISDMATQPVLPPTESRLGKEEVLDISINDITTQPVLPPTESRSEKEVVVDINIGDMATQPVFPQTESRSGEEVMDISISDMATQPVSPQTESRSGKEVVVDINVGDMATQPVSPQTEPRSGEEVMDINISDIATQPVLPLMERRSGKKEVVNDHNISGEMLTVLLSKESSLSEYNSDAGQNSTNINSKKDKKMFVEGVHVFPTKKDFATGSSNLVIEESVNYFEQSKIRKETVDEPDLSKVKKSIDSTSSVNECSSGRGGTIKIFTKQRLKSCKKVIPDLHQMGAQSVLTEILTSTGDHQITEMLEQELLPNIKRMEVLQKQLQKKMAGSEGMMSDNDGESKVNQNSLENWVTLSQSNKKISEYRCPKKDLVSSPRSENFDKFEQGDIPNTEMGRGKRKRVKKLFVGFCTDENLKAEIGENTGDNYNSLSDRLGGSLPVKKRKKKDDVQNTESISAFSYPLAKDFENVNTRKRKNRASRNDAEIDGPSSFNKEIGDDNELNIEKKKKVEHKSMKTIDQSKESLKLSIEEELNNVSPCHDDCSSTFCSKSWNTPKNMSEIKTYSKKNSLTTKESEHSSLVRNEKSKKVNKDSLKLQQLENVNLSPVVKLKRYFPDVKQNQSVKKTCDQNEEKLHLSHPEKIKDLAVISHIENINLIEEQLIPLKTSTPVTKVSKRKKKSEVDETAINQIIMVRNKSVILEEKEKTKSKEATQPIPQSDCNSEPSIVNLDKTLIKLGQIDKKASNTPKLIKGIKRTKLQPNGKMSKPNNAVETNIRLNPVNKSKIKTDSKKKSLTSEGTELTQETDENTEHSVKAENCLHIARNKPQKKSLGNEEKLTVPENVGNTVTKSTTKNHQESNVLIEDKLDPPKTTTSITKVSKRINNNNEKEASNKKTRTNKGEESNSNDSECTASDKTESSPARRSNRKRKINSMLKIYYGPTEKVMFTGYSDPKAITIINKLGGEVVDSANTCTVLVTDKVRRTVKFLCALALGRPIVSPAWLISSKTSSSFLDYEKYLLKDKDAERQFSFNLKESLIKAKRKPFLAGVSVFVTNSVKPPPAEMKSIVECCGGIFLNKISPNWPENSVIVSCKEDMSQFKLKKVSSHHQIVSSEFILTGLLQQNFEPEKYCLQKYC